MVEDRLSALPNDLICCILSFLPMDNVVRTSTLSKRWLNIWKYIKVIHFPSLPDLKSKDDLSSRIQRKIKKGKELIIKSSCTQRKKKKGKEIMEKNKDYTFVDRCLDLHGAQEIEAFVIVKHFDKHSEPNIKKWVDFAIAKHVKCLVFYMNLDMKCEFWNREHDEREDYFVLPKSFYSQNTSSIRQLALSCVEFISPPASLGFAGYASLKRLFLYESKLSEEGIEMIMSTCCVLESLSIIYCYGLRHGPVNISGMALKELVYVEKWHWEVQLLIDAPNLVTLKVYGYVRCLPLFNKSCHPIEVRIIDDWFEFEKNIDDCVVYFEQLGGSKEELMGLLSGLELFGCSLHHFQIFQVLQCMNDGPSPTFWNLKELCISHWTYTKHDVVLLLSVLEDCPSLRKLQIEFESLYEYTVTGSGIPKMFPAKVLFKSKSKSMHDADYEAADFDNEEEELALRVGSLHKLETIEFFSYWGNKDEVKLAKRLLQKAVNLKRFLLFFDDPPGHYVLRRVWQNIARYQFKERLRNELSLFPRASPHAEVLLG